MEQVLPFKTNVAKAIAALQKECAKLFPNATSTKRKECDTLAKDGLNLLPKLDKIVASLAWDAGGFCAAIGGFCSVPCCAHATAPEQVHLALAPDPASLVVTWTTLHNTATHTVEWGTSAANLTHAHAVGGTNKPVMILQRTFAD